jgi:ribosome biogenesis GTPase
MIPLAGGGAVIDSPGVRDFAPAIESPDDVEAGFPDICGAADECRFANCRHLREPGCRVRNAVDAGRIAPRRYESYRRLLALTEKLASRRRRR